MTMGVVHIWCPSGISYKQIHHCTSKLQSFLRKAHHQKLFFWSFFFLVKWTSSGSLPVGASIFLYYKFTIIRWLWWLDYEVLSTKVYWFSPFLYFFSSILLLPDHFKCKFLRTNGFILFWFTKDFIEWYTKYDEI